MKTIILVDDVRTKDYIANIYGFDINECIFIVARTAQKAKILLKGIECDCWIFDHDLGEESECDGYDLIKWCSENVDFCNWPEQVVCCSDNPVGKKNIESFVSNFVSFKEGEDVKV
jgi:hypothetical protein